VTARTLIPEGPLPNLTPGCRVANVLLARAAASTAPTSLLGAREAAQLVGISDLRFMYWQARTFDKCRTRVDLRDLWGVLRWVQPSQLGCFDLHGVEPRHVDDCGLPYYDLLDVLEANGWTIPSRLRA